VDYHHIMEHASWNLIHTLLQRIDALRRVA
jgi:hypothetical protein